MKYKNIEDGYEGIRKRVDLMLEGKSGIPSGIKKIITEVVVRRCEEFSLSAPELNRDLMSLEQSLDTVEFGKMLKGYENAAGLCMGGEKKILLGQGYLGNLRRNENEYGSNWNAFETLTHELGHAMNKDSQGRDRTEHFNPYTGQRMVNLLETINEVASIRTCTATDEYDFAKGIRRCLGYSDLTFTVGVMSAALGFTEKEFLKLGINSYENLALAVKEKNIPGLTDLFENMDIVTENMHTALYPFGDKQKQTTEQINQNVSSNIKSLIEISEAAIRARMFFSKEPAEKLAGELLFNQNKLDRNLEFAINGLAGRMTPEALEETRGVLKEQSTPNCIRVKALAKVVENKEKMDPELYEMAVQDIRTGVILDDYDKYKELYGLDDIEVATGKTSEFLIEYLDKIRRDDMGDGLPWNNDEVLKMTRDSVINNKLVHKIEDSVRRNSKKAITGLKRMAQTFTGNVRKALPAAWDKDRTVEIPKVQELSETAEIPKVGNEDLDKTEEQEVIKINDDPDKTEEQEVIKISDDPDKTEEQVIVEQEKKEEEPELAFGELPPEQKKIAQEGYLEALRAIQTKEGGIADRAPKQNNDREL